MEPHTSSTYWLVMPGSSVSLRPGSVLVGRSSDCDVVLSDPSVSRHHALFRVAEVGVEVVLFGQLPILRNGSPLHRTSALNDGDTVSIAGNEFVLCRKDTVTTATIHWFIRPAMGPMIRVPADAGGVGGGPDDCVLIPEWDPGAIALHIVADGLVLEALKPGVGCDRALEVHDLVTLQNGARVEQRGTALTVVALPADPSHPTGLPAATELPSTIHLQFLPRGGRLTVGLERGSRTLYLSDKRCDLMAVLLQPPAPYRIGEALPDELIAEKLWPDRSSGRLEINTLVCRLRKDLLRAEIDGVSLLERRSGTLRLCLALDAHVGVTAA